MNSLYVYYKVQASHAPALKTAVLRMQLSLRSAMPGLAASLHQRTHSHALSHVDGTSTSTTGHDNATWMETYHFNGHADARAWQQLLDLMKQVVKQLPSGIEGERHEEWFTRTPTEQR